MKYLALVLIVLSPGLLCAQQTDSLRAYYIQEYPDHFFIWPVIKYRSLSFEIRDKDRNSDKIEFKPNNPVSLGAGFYLFDLGFELTFTVPVEERSLERYGKSKARDLQLNILSKKWGADLYYQRYTGFYKDDSRVSVPGGQPYPQRPDIDAKNLGVSGIWVFNNRKFSMRSSFNYAERQLRSKGSFMLYGTVNSFKLSADSAVLSEEARVGLGKGADFVKLRYTTLSIAPGYSYNAVLKKFFLNGTLSVGPAHHWIYYERDNGTERNDISINTTATIRLALGYNSDRFFGGVGFITQSRAVVFDDIRFANSSNIFKILVGYRFREFGVLKKRVWDFVPFI
jgi:hypothetical protein